ncbi:MAG: 50S ribosomal protein L32 [Candidatus Omnitrophota bacterium]|jgi:large subunit ribosomal protein L32
MGLPKRRHSKARGRKRRTHYKLLDPSLAKCPNCGSIVMPHRVCAKCGYYKGRQVVVRKEKTKKHKA